MEGIWDLVIPGVAAVIAALSGVLVGGRIAYRSQREHWSRDQHLDAYARVLRESSSLLIEFATLRRADSASVDSAVLSRFDWKPWNEALAMVSLVAPVAVVNAAHAIDDEVWQLSTRMKAGEMTDDEWLRRRDLVESRRRAFVNEARKELAPASSESSIPRLSGRPSADDPLWSRRRT